MPASTESRHLAKLAAEAALDKLATDVTLIDVSSRFPLSDMFVIASAANHRQVKAVCEGIEKALSAEGVKPSHNPWAVSLNNSSLGTSKFVNFANSNPVFLALIKSEDAM